MEIQRKEIKGPTRNICRWQLYSLILWTPVRTALWNWIRIVLDMAEGIHWRQKTHCGCEWQQTKGLWPEWNKRQTRKEGLLLFLPCSSRLHLQLGRPLPASWADPQPLGTVHTGRCRELQALQGAGDSLHSSTPGYVGATMSQSGKFWRICISYVKSGSLESALADTSVRLSSEKQRFWQMNTRM